MNDLRAHRHVHYRIRSWFRITDVWYTKPAAYPITDIRYRIQGWLCIMDVR